MDITSLSDRRDMLNDTVIAMLDACVKVNEDLPKPKHVLVVVK